MTAKILIADDDSDIVRFVEVNLRLEGFEVITAGDGEEALARALGETPDLVLLDVMMPQMDGYEVCQRLRADARTSNVSIIMLTAKSLSADKVVGLTAGADDYIIKPFDPLELVARVKSALRRAGDLRAVNPLTGLPGNPRIEEETRRRVGEGRHVAVFYADLDNFKAFNDRYGYMRGDDAIKLTADVLRHALLDTSDAFLGHIGGDDFVAVASPEDMEDIERICKQIASDFDAKVKSLYDPEDAERGFVEIQDRRGNVVRYPLLTISTGVGHNLLRPIADHRKISEVASELKNFAKSQDKSSFEIDRRAT